MKIIKAMVLVLSMGWPIFFVMFGFKASILEMFVLFMGLVGTAYVLIKI